jgi:hypothetical protein
LNTTQASLVRAVTCVASEVSFISQIYRALCAFNIQTHNFRNEHTYTIGQGMLQAGVGHARLATGGRSNNGARQAASMAFEDWFDELDNI